MYKTGGFNFPTSAGVYSVTGLGFRPQAVILIGGNRPEVGSLATSLTGPGLFISMNALDWADGVTVKHLMLAPFGNSDAGRGGFRGYENGPISMVADGTTWATVDYRANAIVFDADGFTLGVTNAASGTRPITWLAWGGNDGTEPMQTAMHVAAGGGTYPSSFKGRSSLALNTIGAAFGEDGVNGSSWFSWGSGHYPKWAELELGSSAYRQWRSQQIYNQLQLSSPLGRQGFMEKFTWGPNESGPSLYSTSGVISTIGPALVDGWRRFRPYTEGGSFSTFISEGGGASYNYHADLWFTGEGSCGGVPSIGGGVGATAIISPPRAFDAFDALIFATLNGSFFAGGPGGYLAFGLGILGRDYQGCVAFGKDGSFYQSTDECLASCSSSGVSAYSGAILDDGSVELTVSQGGGIGNANWTGFGAQRGPMWLPQSYRFLTDYPRPRIK